MQKCFSIFFLCFLIAGVGYVHAQDSTLTVEEIKKASNVIGLKFTETEINGLKASFED